MPLVTFALSSHITKRFVNVNLQFIPIQAPTKFHIIDMDVLYHVLLGILWILHNQVVPSVLHQCLKAIMGKSEITIVATKVQFSQEEILRVEATFFGD